MISAVFRPFSELSGPEEPWEEMDKDKDEQIAFPEPFSTLFGAFRDVFEGDRALKTIENQALSRHLASRAVC